MFEELLDRVRHNFGKPDAVAADAGYNTPYIAKILLDNKIRPVMPYTRPHTKKGFFRVHEYVYDEYFDCYICPNDEVLSYETTTKEGYRMYRSNPNICRNCPFLQQCTESRDQTKRISRHVCGTRKRTDRFTRCAKKRLNGYLQT